MSFVCFVVNTDSPAAPSPSPAYARLAQQIEFITECDRLKEVFRQTVNTRSRRAQWQTTLPNLVPCATCREKRRAHPACPTCGTYAKRRVLDV